jgi:type 1 glutamine amidotransferase
MRALVIGAAALVAAGALAAQTQPAPGGKPGPAAARKRVLAWADTRNGVAQHDSVGHALSTIEQLGYQSGAWDTSIRTDSNVISMRPLKTDGTPASGGPSLANVDAIFFMGHREVPIDDGQKAALLQFVRDGGGFVAAHVGLTAFASWPEFLDLLGARFDGHPIVGAGTIVNENPDFPATRHFPSSFAFSDEFYQPKDHSREKIDVLLRLDLSTVPPNPNLRLNGDYPLVWAKTYGKGRVLYSSLGHASSTWDIPEVRQMYLEAIRWALRLSEGEPKPHPMRGAAAAPK